LIEENIGEIWSRRSEQFARTISGHIYFTLKDDGAQLSCVLFRSEAVPHREYLRDGQKLNIEGLMTVYESRGHTSCSCGRWSCRESARYRCPSRLEAQVASRRTVRPGAQAPATEISTTHRLVTSSTGAAIRDVLHVIERRQPGLEIILSPCRVQAKARPMKSPGRCNSSMNGASARVREPAAAHGSVPAMDLILLTRAVAASRIYGHSMKKRSLARFFNRHSVVSAVGHEMISPSATCRGPSRRDAERCPDHY